MSWRTCERKSGKTQSKWYELRSAAPGAGAGSPDSSSACLCAAHERRSGHSNRAASSRSFDRSTHRLPLSLFVSPFAPSPLPAP